MDKESQPDAEVTLEEITKDNLRAVLRLNVKPDQEDFVAPNSVSIAQYHYSEDAWMRAIFADTGVDHDGELEMKLTLD